MSLGSEFKEFAMKGNVVDLAVGVLNFSDMAASAPPKSEILLEEIRDLLAKRV